MIFEEGYKQSTPDHSLFVIDGIFIAILVYIDDIILASNDKWVIEVFKLTLTKRFKLKDIGDLKFFLGLKIVRSKKVIFVSQRQYVLQLLSKFGYLGCKPAKTHMVTNSNLTQEYEEDIENVTLYKNLIAKLLYLPITKPNISYSINKLS